MSNSTTIKKRPIGITVPIRKTDASYFDSTYDTLSQTRANIINLIYTRPGERRMQPTFGCRLWTLVFEQNIDSIAEVARNIVAEDVANWITGVTVTNVDVSLLKNDESTDDRDIYRLHVVINFVVNATKEADSIALNVDNRSG